MEYPIHFFLDYAWDPDRWKQKICPIRKVMGKTTVWRKYAARIAVF
jgi:hypothetical protein